MTDVLWPPCVAPIATGDRPRRRGWRPAAAVAVSSLAHVLLVGLALWSAADRIMHMPGGRVGDDGQGALTVSLVRMNSGDTAPSQTTAETDANARLDKLLKKVRDTGIAVDASPPKPTRSGDAQALFKELAQAAAAAGQAQAGNDEDGFDLWPKVRPCWVPPSNLVVILDIGLDSAGRLAGPPTPVRSSRQPPSRAELLAESAAVQAAVRCAPFLSAAPAAGKKTFRVTFAAGQAGPGSRPALRGKG